MFEQDIVILLQSQVNQSKHTQPEGHPSAGKSKFMATQLLHHVQTKVS